MSFRFSLSALLLRLAVGTIFIIHGQPKLAHPENFVAFFANHSIPGGSAMVMFIGVVELLGGILLVAGLLTRPAAFLLAIDMLVALFAVELREGFALGAQFVTMLLVGNVALLFMGAGSVAIDNSIKQHRYLLSRFFVFVLFIVLPFSGDAAGVGAGGGSVSTPPKQQKIIESREGRPAHEQSGAKWCDDLKSMAARIRCRLNLSETDLHQELQWNYNPEECRTILIRDVDGRARCIRRYTAFQECWEKPVGADRMQCAKSKLLEDPDLINQECVADCMPSLTLFCCRKPKQRQEFQDLLVKFWMYDFSEQAEKSALSKKRIAKLVIFNETAKQRYNGITQSKKMKEKKKLTKKEKLIRQVWKEWKLFANEAKIDPGASINDILKELRAAYR